MKRFLPLSELKKYHLQHRAKGGPLKDMALFTRARLSVQPLTAGTYKPKQRTCIVMFYHAVVSLTVCFFAEEFEFILSLEDKEPL